MAARPPVVALRPRPDVHRTTRRARVCSPCASRSGTLSQCPRSSTSGTCQASSNGRPIIPLGAVYIGRRNARYGLPASKWANPFRPKPGRPHACCCYIRAVAAVTAAADGCAVRTARARPGLLVHAPAMPRRGAAGAGELSRCCSIASTSARWTLQAQIISRVSGGPKPKGGWLH